MWPLQRDCDAFYGNPRGYGDEPSQPWIKANLVRVVPPYRMTYAGHPVPGVQIHAKCADSLMRVFSAIWAAANRNQSVVDAWGASIFGGSFNFRLMRGLNTLSIHSYGAAIDLDPARNGLGNPSGHFSQCPEVVKAFKDEGWEWGGDWPTRHDFMHFQAARVK